MMSEEYKPDEREAFEAFARDACRIPAHIPVNWEAQWTQQAWEGFQAGAAWQRAQSAPYVAVPEELFSELYNHLDNIADFDPSYPPDTEPRNTSAELLLELKALCDGKQMEGK